MLVNYFPSKHTPRTEQRYVIQKLDEIINSGYRGVIINAPTGLGKSFIAMTLASYYGKSNIVTASKVLQDQYISDFPVLRSIKGKSNFRCLLKSNLLTCADVPTKLCNGSKTNKLAPCRYKPKKSLYVSNNVIDCYTKQEVKYLLHDELCEYYDQKYIALNANHTVYNYHEFFTLLYKTRELPSKPITIYDEAHNIENILIDFLGLSVHERFLPEGMKLPQTEDIDKWIELLQLLTVTYKDQLDSGNLKDSELSKIERRLEKCKFVYENIRKDNTNYILDILLENGRIIRGTLKPLYCNKHVDIMVSKFNVFMSATLLPNSLDYVLRNRDDVAYISVGSPFPVDRRRVDLLNVAYLNYKSLQNKMTISKIVRTIENIMQKNIHHRGLILTTSYKLMTEILNRMKPTNKERIITVYENNNIDPMEDKIDFQLMLDKHRLTNNTVILSASHWEGIDLKDDLCRFIVIVKAPYPDLSDKRVKMLSEKNYQWYVTQTLMRLIQGCGRGVRNKDDYCRIYVLDSAVSTLLYKYRAVVPEWFKESIQWNGVITCQ